jgi:hypothetical protein
MIAATASPPQTRDHLFARLAHVVHHEQALLVLATVAIGLHVADDNYLQPQPGTSAGDHLASGLIPIAVLTVVAALYPLLRAGLRASLAMTLGAIGIAVGIPGAYYLLEGSASGDHYSGLLAIVAGAGLLLSGLVTLWRARRTDGSPRRRYLRRTLTSATAVLAALVSLTFIVFPIGYAYIYTHTGRAAVTPDLGVPFENVKVSTSDGLELAASYVPSRNRAAVILFPGSTRADNARMLIRHGYGVLLLDPRGQGRSEGDIVRWAGDRDILGGVDYLRSRPDVDAGRIGGLGFSIGGEILLEAAAKSTGLKAVVAEGAGIRVGEGLQAGEGMSESVRRLWNSASFVLSAATTVFSNHGPPPAIVDRIGRIAPRAVFLIYADPGMGGESTRQPGYFDAAGEPKAIWQVPGSKHTGGIDATPAEYERRVVGFFDHALLGLQ